METFTWVEVELSGRERVYRLEPARLRDVAGAWLTRFEKAGRGEP